MKRRILAFLLVLAMITPMLPAMAADVQYRDINGHWAQDEIERWSSYGIWQGDGAFFHPDESITRAETAAVFNRLMGYVKTEENQYKDLEQKWYTEDVLKASAAGLLQGDSGMIAPEDLLTRQEGAVILCRALGIEEVQGDTDFVDNDIIADWARPSVSALSSAGLVSGVGENRFAPQANMTRAELLKLIDNAVKAYYNKAGTYTGDVDGFVVVSADGVTLTDMTISGNLIVAEGVDGGSVTLENVSVQGKCIVRGGTLNEKNPGSEGSSGGQTGQIHLTEDSLGSAGNRRVTGLDKGRYYTVTKSDGTVLYSRADGGVSENSEDIALLAGTEITGLTAGETYTVKGYDSCEAFASSSEKDMLGKVDQLAKWEMDNTKTTGMAVAVIDNGRIFYRNYGTMQSATDPGVEDPNTRTPVTEDTIFELMSLSKVYTAVMLSYLDAQGVVSMDDPVSKYFELPDYVLPDGTRIAPTLENLSSHTSGFPRMSYNWDPSGEDPDPSTPYVNYHLDRMEDELRNMVYEFVPGTVQSYSNFAVGVLGQCLAKAYFGDEYEGNGGDKKYEDLLFELVCEPLGLDSTGVTMTPEQLERKALPHDSEGNPSSAWDFDAYAPAGGVRGSAKDVAKWIAMQLGSYQAAPALTAAVAETGVPRVNLENIGRSYVGLGWHVQPNRPVPVEGLNTGGINPVVYDVPENAGERYGKLYWHNGAGNGFNTEYMMCPETGTGVVVLVNNNGAADPDRLCGRIMDWALSGNSTGNKANRVVLAEGSLGTAGDRCITGLEPGKYYTAETGTDELKEAGLATTLYVRADGTLTDQFKQAGRLEGTEIVYSAAARILNGQTYMVTASDTAPTDKNRAEYVHNGLFGEARQLYENTGVIRTSEGFPYPDADRYDISGLSLAYIWDNDRSSTDAEVGYYNFGETEKGESKISEHTLFEVGTFSDVFMSLAAVKLQSQGYLDISEFMQEAADKRADLLVSKYNANADTDVQDYTDLLELLVLDPHGFDETGMRGSTRLDHLEMAQPHLANGQPASQSEGDVLLSTPADLSRLLRAYLLAQNTQEAPEELKDLIDALKLVQENGLGFEANETFTWHTAWTPGYCVSFVADGTASGSINAALFVINNNTDTGDFNEGFFANKMVTHYLKPGRAV